jgi:hypothetical protein
MQWIKMWTYKTLKGSVIVELDATERGIWFTLLLLAGSSLTSGVVEMAKNKPYPEDYLIKNYMGCDEKTFKAVIKKLKRLDMIKVFQDGRIKITNWWHYQTRYEKYYKDKKNKEEHTNSNGIHMPGRKEENNGFTEEIEEKMQATFMETWLKEKKTKYQPRGDQKAEESALRKIYGVCLARSPDDPLKFFQDHTPIILNEFKITSISMLATYFNFDTSLIKRRNNE